MASFARLPVFVLLAALAGCGGGAEHLTVEPTRIDFGRVLHGDVVERPLVLENGGQQDVTISRTTFNCACFSLGAFGRLLHPGERRELVVAFDAGAIASGPMRAKHLDILTTDPARPRLQVELVGQVVRSVTVLPRTIDLGRLGGPRSLQTWTIEVRPGPDMRVELLRVRAEPAADLEVSRRDVDGGFDLSVRWRPGEAAGRGRFLGSVAVRTRVAGAGFESRELEHAVRVQGEWP